MRRRQTWELSLLMTLQKLKNFEEADRIGQPLINEYATETGQPAVKFKIWLTMAHVKASLLDFQSALKLLNETVSIDAHSVGYRFRMAGECCLEYGMIDEAISFANRGLERDSQYEDLQILLGRSLVQKIVGEKEADPNSKNVVKAKECLSRAYSILSSETPKTERVQRLIQSRITNISKLMIKLSQHLGEHETIESWQQKLNGTIVTAETVLAKQTDRALTND